MALTLPKCQEILARLREKFHIEGLETLEALSAEPNVANMGPLAGQEFTIKLYQKSNDPIPDDPAVIINGMVFNDGELEVSVLRRDLEQGAAKGAGKLLLELVACRAAELGLTLTLDAVSGERLQPDAEKLYRFYNSAGLQRSGPEKVKYKSNGSFSTRFQHYKTSPETLRTRYSGGGNNNTLKVENMALSITADGIQISLAELKDKLDTGSRPGMIRVSKGDKHRDFRFGNNDVYTLSTSQIGPGLQRHNAMIPVEATELINKIKSEFGLAGGRRKRTKRRRKSTRRR